MESGVELLTTLAVRQLRLGQSAILDFPAEDPAIRTRWRTLAAAAGASFRVVLCVCSDPGLHQARLEGRQRGIPGWHDAGHWPNVQRRLAEFRPWTDEDRVLTVDGVRPAAGNLAAALEYPRVLPGQDVTGAHDGQRRREAGPVLDRRRQPAGDHGENGGQQCQPRMLVLGYRLREEYS